MLLFKNLVPYQGPPEFDFKTSKPRKRKKRSQPKKKKSKNDEMFTTKWYV